MPADQFSIWKQKKLFSLKNIGLTGTPETPEIVEQISSTNGSQTFIEHKDLFKNALRDYTNYHSDPASSQTNYDPSEDIRKLEEQKIRLNSINLTLEKINRVKQKNNQIVNTKLNPVMGCCTEVITRIKEQTLPKIDAIENDCKIILEDLRKNLSLFPSLFEQQQVLDLWPLSIFLKPLTFFYP